MSESPILFSAPMVRAILEGRKTQTRRVVKPQPDFISPENTPRVTKDPGLHPYIPCPYGQPGDRLWVRETWRIGAWDESRGAVAIDYKADGYCRRDWIEIGYGDDGAEFEHYWIQCTDDADKAGIRLDENGEYKWEPGQSPCRYRPSIHMPRWASRINLEIVAVRVERLQDISKEDAIAEGLLSYCGAEQWWGTGLDGEGINGCRFLSPIECYRALWDALNGPGSWDANPWVWVVEFKRVTP